jgi:hypothetical protein
MTQLTFTQITKSIRDTLASAKGMNRAESGQEITESIPDVPLLQVYFETEDTDGSGNTGQTTFRAGVRVSHVTVHTDVYVSQRAHIDQDIAACEAMAEEVRSILADQKIKPYFGLDGLQAFQWRAQRVTFTYGAVDYSGIRFVIEVYVF